MKTRLYPGLAIAASILIGACGEKSATPDSEAVNNQPQAETETPTWVAHARVANPLKLDRPQEPLYFSYYDLGLGANSEKNASVVVLAGAQPIPQQHIDSDGDGIKDGIQVALDLQAGETLELEFIFNEKLANTSWPKLTQAEISHKEGGSWEAHPKVEGKKAYVGGSFKNVKELTPPPHYTDHSNWIRYEGPGIESDKVGYRIYLDWRNGFDIFGKNIADPVLQKIGQDGYESYHHMQDWGMDILKVGESLGAGGFGTSDGEKVKLISDVGSHTARIVEDGPIYSSFNITYQNWKSPQGEQDLSAHFSMNAGSRLVHVQVKPDKIIPKYAIGIVKHEGTEFIEGPTDIPGDTWTYIASWGKQSLNDDMLGMAVFFKRREFSTLLNDPKSYAVEMKGDSGKLEYYFAAAWAGEHSVPITNKEDFVKYLDEQAQKLTLAPRVALKTAVTQAFFNFPITADSALAWSIRMADSELARKTLDYAYGGWDAFREREPKFEYDIVGLVPMAYHELAKETGDQKHKEVVQKVTASYIEDDGTIKAYKMSNYNIDSVAPGRAIMRLIEDDPQEKYKQAAATLRKQLQDHPRTSEGAFWHKQRYPWQLWLDGVYMGMPFLAQYSAMFEEGKAFEEVVKEFEITRKYLRDESTGLYYHAWDEKKQQIWADPETGLSKYFWGRGVGWLAMALVDTLDYLPADNEALRKPVLDMTKELAATLLKYQDSQTGTWWQILNMPGEIGNYRESSASAMFTYFLAKATRMGYIDESYREAATRSYESLIREFVLVHTDGKISYTQQCLVAGLGYGRDGSYHYYISEQVYKNDPKAVGPFILAGIEVSRLLR